MLSVPRHVRSVQEDSSSLAENPIRRLQAFCDQPAWVLLGEPGAGKSEAFKETAKASGGLFISIAEFLIDEAAEERQGKILFLDGLDEIRAGSSGDSILLKICTRLKKLGNPPFRIACRAADWFGSSDREIISAASPDGQLVVLQLEPLSDEDILDILRQNHAIPDPETFVEKAQRHGVADLLQNPQTLGLLAQAIRGDRWPTSREKTFELACEKLAAESNKSHRDKLRSRPRPIESLLNAAGQIYAALLLSDKTGIALDPASANERFPVLEGFSPPDLEMAIEAVRTRLFSPSASGEERVLPSHRSIAEYLAGRWLAHQIDRYGLPLGRVLNLLLGMDGRTVAGLRGLYGWLALHCHAARSRLIEADPMTVVIYGDVKPMPCGDKQRILTGLKQEAERHAAFRWESRSAVPFGALADLELIDHFMAVLASSERDPATQSFVECILVILAEGEALPALAPTLRNVIVDDTRWGSVRMSALQAWLKLGTSAQEALALLDAISDGQITDTDDELSGLLLSQLYPQSIEPATLLRYLHVPKNQNLTGNFAWFWGHELPKVAPESHLPILLDGLAVRTDLGSSELREFHLRRMLGALLVKGLNLQGEKVNDEQLFAWLGIGADEFGDIQREEKDRLAIANWLEIHPERYKALLALCDTRCACAESPRACIYKEEHRLHGAVAPLDIGLWHLKQVSQTSNADLAENHLFEAVKAVMYERGNLGLTLEQIEVWGDANPERKHWLAPMLAWEVPGWRIEQAARAKVRKQDDLASKRARSINLTKHLDAIRAGTANPALMHELAGVWLDHFTDTHGNTPSERFESYCENGMAVLSAAECGFRLCPARDDLPTVLEIINLSIKQKEHFIRRPCLVGMELRWQDGAEAINSLDNDTLRRMLVFRLTYGADNTPDWFTYFVVTNPGLVAEVLIDYATATLKSRQSFVEGIYPLTHDPNYRAVASIAVPALLERFPLRTKSGQLGHLEQLLKATLHYSLGQLLVLVEKKIVAKSIDVAQKVYWLTAAMLLDPKKYESVLWGYIGNSSSRAGYLSTFLSERFVSPNKEYELSVRTLGKLIELLMPHAELDWPKGGGYVNEVMRRGDHIRSMVTQLGALGTDEAAQEIERLLVQPGLNKLKFSLESSRHQLRLKQREKAFCFPSLAGVAQILANQEPTDVADLAVLALDCLDDIAKAIRQDKGDLFRHFWTETAANAPKPENSCRDFLLDKLKASLGPFGIDCQGESDHFNDKRADILLSYRNEFAIPIEIKGEWNDSLWAALRSQLIEQYAIDPKAGGHGIYLVLWFGGERQKPARDQGKKPRSAIDLQARLEAQLDTEERQRIFVQVMDVSWPKKP